MNRLTAATRTNAIFRSDRFPKRSPGRSGGVGEGAEELNSWRPWSSLGTGIAIGLPQAAHKPLWPEYLSSIQVFLKQCGQVN
jgi:hypothetical protein